MVGWFDIVHQKLNGAESERTPFSKLRDRAITLPETNIAPENGWLEY